MESLDLEIENAEPPESPAVTSLKADDVFTSGDEDGTNKSNNLLHADYGCTSDQLLPRKSSLIKDSNRRNRRKKTVSFSSMPGERTVINAPDCLYYMQTGSELIKVRPNGRQYRRLFLLDTNLREIRWHPSSKKPHKAKIAVDQIKEVRVGKNTDVLRSRELESCYQDTCVFSIIFGDAFESLDLIASTPDEANIWVTGLTFLTTSKNKTARLSVDGSNLTEVQQLRDQWLQEVFDSADVDRVGELDEFEVVRLMKKLNNSLATVKIQQKLKEMSTCKDDRKETITSSEFISLFKEISTRPEIYFLLVRYASASDYMNIDELLLFLEAEQGMSQVTVEKCHEIIAEFEPSTQGKQLGQLGIDGFTAYLLSEECDIFDPIHLDVCQNMTQPLSHYFIASSYKTYLLKDQLKGPSSVDGYSRALKKGCRYIEVECWDGPDDEPVVYHGHTLTSKVAFKAVIDCINEYAFEASDYPLILSIETHCGIKQQQTMAFYMRQVFGDKLFVDVVDSNLQQLPSPDSLRKKILIKCKKIPIECDSGDGYVTDEDETTEIDQQRKTSRKDSVPAKKYKLCRDLSNLAQYCQSSRFVDFRTSLTQGRCYELCSLSESLALRYANTVPEEFVNHNKYFLSRVYPNGMRVDSSNYNPQDFWNCGCQIVALNYQTCGLMMDLYDGRFLQNGGCGYVLKPAIMRDEIAYFSMATRDIIPGVSPQILHVKILSGQQLPKPKASGAKGNTVDPYVTVEIFGIPADCVEERTKTVHHATNPIFDESFEFQINLPELALVRFAVLDDDFIGDEFIGQYTLPFVCMQPGYRHIRLRSNTGETIPNATLFVHIAVTNRKGGGKSGRRGSLLRKKKSNSSCTSLKTLTIKVVDDTFKVAAQPLGEAAELWDAVQGALTVLKEVCGLAPISNIKQTMRALLTRIVNAFADTESSLILVSLRDGFPMIEVQAQLPDAIKKALQSFDVYIDQCRCLCEKADAILEKLESSRSAAMEYYEELQNLAIQNGVKGKKLNKTVENFAWNVRVLKGQADLLRQAKVQCHEDMKQIKDTAVFMGLVQSSPKATSPSAAATLQQTSVQAADLVSSSRQSSASDVSTNEGAVVAAVDTDSTATTDVTANSDTVVANADGIGVSDLPVTE